MKAPTARNLAQAIKCHSLASEYLHGYFSSFTRAPIKKIEIANISPLLRALLDDTRNMFFVHIRFPLAYFYTSIKTTNNFRYASMLDFIIC